MFSRRTRSFCLIHFYTAYQNPTLSRLCIYSLYPYPAPRHTISRGGPSSCGVYELGAPAAAQLPRASSVARERTALSRPRNRVKDPPHSPRRETYSGTGTGPVPVTCTCNATRAPPGGDRFMIVGQGATAAVPTGSAECMPQLVLEDLALGSSGFRCAHPAVHARTCPIVA